MGRLLAGILLLLAMFGAGGWQPRDPAAIDLSARLAGVSADHPLGTDHLGRDLLSRLLVGAGRTAAVVVSVTLVAGGIGLGLGTLSAFAPPVIGTALVRIADLGMILPPLVLALAAGAVFGLSPLSAGLALGLGGAGPLAVLTSGLVRRARTLPHVRAAVALGLGHGQALARHIAPEILGVLRAHLGADTARHAVSYASLAYLGLGVEVGQPDWGAMLFEYRPFMLDHPILMLAPGGVIFLTALALHLLIEPAFGAGVGSDRTSCAGHPL